MIAPVGPEEHLRPSPDVHTRRFDDEVVLLDLLGGEYFSLNGAGARIWEALASGKTPADVAAGIASEYDVDLARALEDCLALAGELLSRGLLQRSNP